MRAAIVSLALFTAPLFSVAAAPMQPLENGGAQRGASRLVIADTGRMNLFVGGESLIRNAAIACGFNGYTTSEQFTNRKVQRELGGYYFEGSLPGGARFYMSVRTQADDVRFSIHRQGDLPEGTNWTAFQMTLGTAMFAGLKVVADEKEVILPEEYQPNAPIAQGARHIVIAPGDARRQIEISSDAGISINDGRRWGDSSYQISIPLADKGDTVFSMRLPDGGSTAAQLRTSQIGYSVNGLKEATLEWPKGTDRPSDALRIEDDKGSVVLSGQFGETITYPFMQSDFATFAFPDLTKPGWYKIVWSGGERQFQVKQSLFTEGLWARTLDTFIPWQMCHANIRFSEGALPELPACHMDDGQRVPAHFPGIDGFRSYEADLTPYKEGDMIACAVGGWHDAGDYDINVPANSYTLWKLALTWEEFGVDHDRTTIDVEKQQVLAGKGDGVPDLLQQVEWGARWMLTMQQEDGLVYTGVCGRPGEQYTAAKLPETLSDGKPGTKDERYVYVDYSPGAQLDQIIGLSAAARVLRELRPEFSGECLKAAESAYAYFVRAPLAARPNAYFEKRNEHGRDAAHAAALAELYMATSNPKYLQQLESLTEQIRQAPITWPAAYATSIGGWWYAPPVLARLAPRIPDGTLKDAILELCTRAVTEQAAASQPRPWPFMWWHLQDWGNTGHALNRVFDAYFLEQVVEDSPFSLAQTQREMLWMFGYRPANDTVFVCGVTPNATRYLYNGRLHGRYGDKPASVPGAVVPGMGGVAGADVVFYHDAHGNYFHNEACIYTAADYLFAVHALKAAGY